MRKCILKKAFVLAMSVLMLCASVNAADLGTDLGDEMTPRYAYTDDIYSSLSINSAGAASCSSSATAISPSYEVNLTMTLQRYDNGWKTVKEWDGSNDWSASLSGTWYVVSGYDYRVEAKATIKNTSGKTLETATVHSTIVEY